jgi:DNA-binding SARP family transcriptional activator
MPALSVHLFGNFRVGYEGRVINGFDSRKVQELFCYLLLHRNAPRHRETLATLLWCDNPTAQSKKYLRQALWQLQSMLHTQSASGSDRLLIAETDWVQINPTIEFWLDVAVFEEAFELNQGKELDARSAQVLHDAVSLYKGDLLEGCYQDWCLYERERFQNMYLAMLDRLMVYCEANKEYEAGLAYGASILRCDRARERTHRQIMRLHYFANDRTAALRQYERCIAALREELGVRPTRRTQALYEQIRDDQLDVAPQTSPTEDANSQPLNALLPEVLDHLKELRAALSTLQRRIQKDIKTVELTLNNRR